ncbi:cupin domain-containing protein [Ruegeria spongiae]|uniref:cupin domain-containing protein n=1 Tax=Ruegeria spongiae TaxID=2942209 RepID=UPI0035710B3D
MWFKFASDDETTLTGVWECPPCREEIDAYPVYEMMTVISGSVTLAHPDGDAETFTAGDAFLIKKGSRLISGITENLRKYYMIVS